MALPRRAHSQSVRMNMDDVGAAAGTRLASAVDLAIDRGSVDPDQRALTAAGNASVGPGRVRGNEETGEKSRGGRRKRTQTGVGGGGRKEVMTRGGNGKDKLQIEET